MGRKSKIITAVFSLCLIAFGVVFAMTNIISATQATANSSFTVSFTALSVDTTVSVKYYQPSTPSGTNFTPATLSLNENTTTGSLSGAAATFTVQNFYVIYEFTFVNNDNSHAMRVDMTRDTTSDSNIKVFYLVDANNSGDAITDLSTLEAKRALLEPNDVNQQLINSSPPTNVNIAAKSTGEFTGKLYMLVRINSFSTDSSFSVGSVTFTLNRVAASS